MKVWVLISVITIAACTSTSEQEVLQDRSLAILRGEASELSSVFNSVNPVFEASFSSLNGQNVQALGGYISNRELKIEPGQHTVVVNCHWARGDLKLRSAQRVTREFVAGSIYRFKPYLAKGGKCELEMNIEKRDFTVENV